jgi:hypothetical protein
MYRGQAQRELNKVSRIEVKEVERLPRPRLVVKNDELERPVDPQMTKAMAAIRQRGAKLA